MVMDLGSEGKTNVRAGSYGSRGQPMAERVTSAIADRTGIKADSDQNEEGGFFIDLSLFWSVVVHFPEEYLQHLEDQAEDIFNSPKPMIN